MLDRLSGLIILWIFIACYFLFALSKKGKIFPTAGISIIYLINFYLMHWFGAFICIFPWFSSPDLHGVELGFKESTYALIGFVIGSIIIAPAILKNTYKKRDHKIVVPNQKLPARYIITGLIIYFFPFEFIKQIPTLRVIYFLSWNFIISGICLWCWLHLYVRGKKIFLSWIALTLLFPFFTTITKGFLGLGMAASLSICIFVSTFYRPRTLSIIAIFVTIYIGLSLFVTYMREREEIREAVWGGESTSVRLEKVFKIVDDFEFVNFRDEDHLRRIDSRLNENYIIGSAVDYLEKGHCQFARGETLYNAIYGLIPRILWPGKQIGAGGSALITKYSGIPIMEGTSVGMGRVMEFYINFGTPFVIFGFIILGIIMFSIDVIAKDKLYTGNWQSFIIWFMIGLGIIQTEGYVVETVMTVGSSLLFYFTVNKWILPIIFGRNYMDN